MFVKHNFFYSLWLHYFSVLQHYQHKNEIRLILGVIYCIIMDESVRYHLTL